MHVEGSEEVSDGWVCDVFVEVSHYYNLFVVVYAVCKEGMKVMEDLVSGTSSDVFF